VLLFKSKNTSGQPRGHDQTDFELAVCRRNKGERVPRDVLYQISGVPGAGR